MLITMTVPQVVRQLVATQTHPHIATYLAEAIVHATLDTCSMEAFALHKISAVAQTVKDITTNLAANGLLMIANTNAPAERTTR
jgi:hypothetical protein